MLETDVASAAVARAGTIFFDAQLNPVMPEVGQWFCEYDDEWDHGESNYLRDGAMVEYVGLDDRVAWNNEANDFTPCGDPMLRHLVAPEYSDDVRRPQGRILVRQS